MTSTNDPWWERRWFLLAAILLSGLPLLWPTVPPLTDLPGHIGRYRVMLGTDNAILGQWYRFDWRLVGNLGVDLLVAGLGPYLGLEPTVKLVVIAIPMLTVAGTLWVSHELHGRVSPFALFALPLAYNYTFQFGFVNYTLAMALALPAWALWLRLGRQNRLRMRAILFLVLAPMLWIGHLVGWAMLCLFAFGGEWATRRAAGRGVIDGAFRAGMACLPLAPPILLMIPRNGSSGGTIAGFFNPYNKLHGLASILRDRWMWLDLPSVILLWGVIYAAVRGSGGRIEARGAAASALAGLAFVLMPFAMMSSAYADIRLLPYALLVALAATAPRPGLSPRVTQAIALGGLAFAVIRLVGTTASFAIYDREWKHELAALDSLPRGSRVFAMTGGNCFAPWAYPRLTHLPGLATARRASFANNHWAMQGAPLLHIRTEGLGYFATDPSQIVVPEPCVQNPELLAQSDSLAHFPRTAFTHLWLIRPLPLSPGELKGMTVIWRDGTSMLLRIDHQARLPSDPPLH